MAAEHRARAQWQGDLKGGSGRVELASRVAGPLPVSWSARADAAVEGTTSPEELIAGAHAACFAMALSNVLAAADSPPTSLDVNATATFERTDEGFSITTMILEVRGDVPGLDAASFEQHAATAKDTCPVSRALRNNVAISVKATIA